MSHIPYETYVQSADYVTTQLRGFVPEVGIICGSGLGSLADTLEGDTITVRYDDIPGFVRSTTDGHKGQLVFGMLSGKRVVCMQGRFHCYEGYTVQQATFPIRVMHLIGVKTLVVTNAAGSINPSYEVGDVVLIADHLSLPGIAGCNALVGPNIPEFGVRFPSISDLYTPRLRRIAAKAYLTNTYLRQERNLRVHEGVYSWCFGPCYESRTELRALRTLGADLVGMSTVPETVVAKHCGMDVLAMSLVTNKCVSRTESNTIEAMAVELSGTPVETLAEEFPNHEEVLLAVAARTSDIQAFVSSIVRDI
ncbi:Purine nucleoside phosphorylase [Coemansia sp. RSA 1813]|nr:Purine nucleoside phosphorylase [Coemansia sp. RSA 1646]KAJ1770763.1 Purine nucleoside phosphorylase [Coemansia sp. RSA 1843]KAJ2091520.1 Purine nucleoside phosphorylase [Coemansia sp. RSA 986]KAJ2215179.1 Purine nucleoside phosphorylase [Coemansia sp. RSA 487]KAJ2572279.1 Purine nucleoside phosphorylase [Coemansia sp. RSA 1813]